MRRRGRDAPGLVQVEMHDARGEGGPVEEPSDGASDPVRARVLRWVGLSVVVALVGAIVTVSVLDNRRAASRAAALSDLAWVLPPLEPPLTEVWRSSGGWTVAQTADVIVVGSYEGDMRALDLASGAVLWTRAGPFVDVLCSALLDYRVVRFDQAAHPEVISCHPNIGYQQGTPAAGFVVPVDFIEIATGAVMEPLAVDGFLVMSDVVEDDLLVTFVDASAALGALRWDPRSGEVWSYRSAPGLVPNGAVVDYFEPEAGESVDEAPTRLSYDVAEGVLRLTGEIALDLATGQQVPVPALDASITDGFVEPLPDGGSVEWRFGSPPLGGSETGRVLDADGSLRFEVDGLPWSAWQTDGSAPDVLTVWRPDGGVFGMDLETGEPRWTSTEMADTWPAFVLENTMVVVGPTAVSALDVRDGEVLWRVDLAVWNGTAATDGDVVLMQVGSGYAGELVALDLSTGVEAWRSPLPGPGSYWQITHGGGNVLLFGDGEIVALR